MADLVLIALRRKLEQLEKRGDKGRAELLKRRIDARVADAEQALAVETAEIEAEEASKEAPKPKPRAAKSRTTAKAKTAEKKSAPKRRAKAAPEPVADVVFTPAEPAAEDTPNEET